MVHPLELDPQALAAQLRSSQPPVVVDVRAEWEVRLCPFPTARHIPLGELAQRATAELAAVSTVVLVCHHGVRSLQGAMVLRSLGFSDVKSLRGGTHLYSQTVDPGMPRY
jgi:rhodanese-related sulfurtransferase